MTAATPERRRRGPAFPGAHETAGHCATALGLYRRVVDGDGREDAQDRLGRPTGA